MGRIRVAVIDDSALARKVLKEGLAGADDLAQGLHGLFERRVGIVAVALVEVDVVGPQARQRGVDLLVHLGAGQALVAAAHVTP